MVAMERAERHVKAHGGAMPSVKRLAELVGTSRPTMDRAMTESTYLRARKAEDRTPRRAREVPLSDELIENTAQTTEPTESLEHLIEAQRADQRRDQRQRAAAKSRRR